MARIRTIKPDFFANEQVGAVSYQWRLLFIGLWTHADREGRLQDRPQRLKALLFPYDDLDVNEGLESLSRVGLITRYDAEGMKLIEVPTFTEHQQPHIKEAASVLPPPNGSRGKVGASTVLAAQEGKGTDQEGKGTSTHALRARFDVFWQAYPKKVGKDAALKEWLKRSPDAELLEVMLATLAAQRASAQWRKDGGEFIPHPRTWLHQGRWQDEVRQASERPSWVCPHVDRCQNRDMCAKATILGRPTRKVS